jgi:membrane-associated phospholipid phosphatase
MRHCSVTPVRLACWWCAATLAALPAAAQNATPHYTAGWRDVAVTAGGLLVAGAGAVARPPVATCAPCAAAGLPGIDRGVLGWNSSAARSASTVALIAGAGATALGALSGMEPARARGNAVVLAEAVSWTSAATEWLKVGVHRARPALYRSGAPAAAGDPDNRESFPSGHTSVAFAAASAYTTLAIRQQLPHARRNGVLLFLGATGVGVLRVVGGRHFPTDVFAGAVLGTAVGWGTARLHPMTP